MNRGRIFPWVQFAAKFWVPWLAIFLLMVPVLQLSAKGHSLKGDTRAGSTEQAVTENQITPVAESAWPGEVTNDSQQPARRTIRGKITDQQGAPLPGVTITILGTTRGVITDNDGSYSIDVASTDRLVYSFIGLESQIVDVGNQTTINVTMKEKTEELEDVTVVAFAKQKKESVLASIETVKPEELRVPSSNLTTALAGRMSGIISYQRSGEPGQDNAEFFIRGVTTFGYKKDPLILIDGIGSLPRN